MRFIFYIVSIFTAGILNHPLIVLASFIIFNPAGEAIYLRKTNGIEVFTYPLEYLKENWYIWIPHVLVLIFLSRFVYFGISINPLNMYLSPIYLSNLTRVGYTLILGIYFVFRGVLFKETRSSSMRKRKYMGINW